MFSLFDFNERPFLIIWETTRACDLSCVHCRAAATPDPEPDELTHEEAKRFIADVHRMGTPILIFSGGDPLKRTDLEELVSYARGLGLRTGVIPAVTQNLTRERMKLLARAGLHQIAFSLDSADPIEHDQFRRVPGVYDRTLRAVKEAREVGLRVQINSLVNVHNTDGLDALIELVENLPIVFWEIFFLVPTGRGKILPLLEAEKFKQAFEKIYAVNKRASFIVKVTEAPHYRRFVQEKKEMAHALVGARPAMPRELTRGVGPDNGIGHAPQGVNSGKGFLFVSSRGNVMPSGFLPIHLGNVREESVVDIYRESPVLKELRNPLLLKGRCGDCTYADICGGSRARA